MLTHYLFEILYKWWNVFC